MQILRAKRISSVTLRNALFNYGGVVWRAGLSILLIPIYVQHLPAHDWGIVAVCMTLQGILALVDAGLSQILPRDIAQSGSSLVERARTFAVYSKLYLYLGSIVFCVGQLSVPVLQRTWLDAETIQADSIDYTLRITFILFFFQFWNTVHIGYWNGAQQQHFSNASQIIFATAKHGASLALILYWSNSSEAYLLAFSVGAFLEWTANRIVIRRSLDITSVEVSSRQVINLAKSTATLSAGVIFGILVSQADRLMLPLFVSISDYGRYIAVASLGLAFFQFQSPVITAFFPRLASELPNGNNRSLRLFALCIIALNVIPCVLAAIAAPYALSIWIRDNHIVEVGTFPLQLIFLAIALNSIYQIFYQKIIIYNDGKFILLTNAANAVAVLLLLYLAAPELGISAGGIAWILSASLQLLAGITWSVVRKPQMQVLSNGN